MPSAPARTVKPTFWDRFGIGLSLLCLAHCLAVPALLTGASVLAAESLHLGLALVAAPVAGLALLPGYREHRHQGVLVLGLMGVLLLLAAVLLEPAIGDAGERAVTIAGGLLLVGTHGWNWRARTAVHVHA